ncbi:unnamed protein product, partial [Didymodactylos carnosus]
MTFRGISEDSTPFYSTPQSQNLMEFRGVRCTASYAQERIWIDEHVRSKSGQKDVLAIYNIPILFKITSDNVSIEKLRHSLLLVIEKHSTLRTALKYDQNEECLMQTVKPMTFGHDLYKFQISKIRCREELEHILFDEETNGTYFDLANGIVFRCHVVRMVSDIDDDDPAALNARINDYILFNFHHVAYDGNSLDLFLTDLESAYDSKKLQPPSWNYIDYSAFERQTDMTNAEEFWKLSLSDYETGNDWLPCHCRKSEKRTLQGSFVRFELDENITEQMLQYALKARVSMFQLCITCYYIFLFKLSNGETDQCVGTVNVNRYRPELQSIVGMFVNLLPYRMKLDPTWSFEHTLLQVQNLCLEVLQYAHVPYQKIIQLHGLTGGKHLPYLTTFFQFESALSKSETTLDNAIVSLVSTKDISFGKNVALFDLLLGIKSDSRLNTLQCSIDYSTDSFDRKTIEIMCDRFCVMLQQLFGSSSLNSATLKQTPICELSILLPYEINLL